jgi:hypothetical protein
MTAPPMRRRNVVERARRLAVLATPEDAFTNVTHCWTDGDGYPRIVRQIRPEFEMVVASTSNAAVENVTTGSSRLCRV